MLTPQTSFPRAVDAEVVVVKKIPAQPFSDLLNPTEAGLADNVFPLPIPIPPLERWEMKRYPVISLRSLSWEQQSLWCKI